MSYGGNGNDDGFDLGFEVPEQRVLREKIEEVVPPSGELAGKVEQVIVDQLDEASNLVNDNLLRIVAQIAAGLGDAKDRQGRLNSKVTPLVNHKLSESQVPGLLIIREADQVFDSLLGERTQLITQVVEQVPQWRALLYWVWKNEVKGEYPNLTKDDFGKAGADVWEAAIGKAKAGGVRNIASILKKAQTELDTRNINCPDGGTWVEPDPITGGGYCEDVPEPEEMPAVEPEQQEVVTVVVGDGDKPPIIIGEDTPDIVPADADSKWTHPDISTLTDEFGPYGDVKAAISFYGPGAQYLPFGPGCIQVQQPPHNRRDLPRLPYPYDWWSDSSGMVKHVSAPPNEYLIAYNKNDQRPYQIAVCWDDIPQRVTEPEEECVTTPLGPYYDEKCPPVCTPCIEVNCVTGIAPVPAVLPLDCDPADPECDIEESREFEEMRIDCEAWYVFYSPTDKGCYHRCDNPDPIRPNDLHLGKFDTKEEADQVIATTCQDKSVPEIYYPGETPRPQPQSTPFPSIRESYFCTLNDWVTKFIEPIIAGYGASGTNISATDMMAVFGINQSGRVPFLDRMMEGATGPIGIIMNALNNWMQSMYVGVVTGLAKLIHQIQHTRDCFSPAWTGNFTMYLIWGLLAQYVGPAFGQLVQQPAYRVQAECPQLLPELEPSISMYLAGKITHKELIALTRLNNYCFEPVEKLVQARESQYTTQELLMLRMRNKLSEKDFKYEVRRNGYLAPNAPDRLWDLHRAIPPISDLVRFMVRDVADESVAAKYGWDDFFGEKWTGDVEKWSKEQGVDEHIAKGYWRAHWQMPAPSQLFEMMHRLSRLPANDPAYTDMATIDEAMRVNDWPVYWIERFKAISFRRLTRVDVRRAFMIGSIDRAAVVEAYQQLGYKRKEANILADFAESLLVNRLEKSRDVKLYRQGYINAQETRARLMDDGAKVDQANKIIAEVDDELASDVKEKCADNVRKRFLEGTIGAMGVHAELLGLGINLNRVNQLMELWTCERKSVDKKPTTSNLCKFKEQGLINDGQFITALRNLGWDANEIANIIKSCNIDIATKQQRAIDRAARKALALARRNAADLKKRQNAAKADQKAGKAEDAKALAKAKRAEKAREAAIRANLRRQSVLVKAADKLADIYGISLDDALYTVNVAWRAIKARYEFDSNKATEVIKVAASTLPKKDPPPFEPHLASVAEGYDVLATSPT